MNNHSMNFPRKRLPIVLLLSWLALSCARGAAADDDEIVVSTAAATAQEVADMNVNFDQWIFPGAQNAAVGWQRIQTQVSVQLADVDRVCRLAEDQKQLLQLAAQGDVQRFEQQVEALRRKFDATKHDQEAVNNMWQDIQPLQRKQQRSLTGHDSLFKKILGKTLTPEQSTQYEALDAERRRFQYEASIKTALILLEGTLVLKHEQREALTKLLLELPAPRAFGRYDHYLINYRLATMPPEKIQPLLDNRQWQTIKQQFNQYRGMRQMLMDEGLLSRDDLAEPVAEIR